jgi:DNA uptake protein ComE-like DNA-binding protein
MLLIVTLVLTTLTLSAAALLTLMKTEKEATSTHGRKELVHGVARSAVVYLVGCVEESPENRQRFGGLYSNPNYFCARPLLTADEGGDDTSRFTIISPKLEDSTIDGIRYGLVDESSRLNLEQVLEWDKESPGAGRTALMKLPGMTQIAADSILDWIDPDEQGRQYGAEAKYYADAKLPYSPRNATPVFLEELLLVRGVTRAQIYGSDENFTYGAESSPERQAETTLGGALTGLPRANSRSAARNGAGAIPWTQLMTVFSAEKDVDPQGEARVNLNVDNLQFLYRELASRVGEDLAKFVVLYRQYGPETSGEAPGAPQPGANSRTQRASNYTTAGQNANAARGRTNARSGYLQTAAPSAAPVNPNVTVGSLDQAPLDYNVPATTNFTTPLDLVGARVVINDVAYPSPLQDSRDTANVARIMTLLDYASTSDSTTIVGRVNVNVASRPVLSAIPGLADADVQRIIDDRPDPSAALPADFRHSTWLYTKGLVSLDMMKSLYNKTTARGDVYRGQIVGFLDFSNEIERAEVVVDGTTEPPRQVFYKDLSTLGKGFSDATLLGGFISDNAQTMAVTALDWDAASGILELERDSSGYLAPEDPFAALDALAGADPFDAMNADMMDFPNALDPDASSLTGGAEFPIPGTELPGDPNAPDENETAATETDAGNEQTSQRQRMLDALQSARQTRQARNTGIDNAQPDPATEQPDATDGNEAANTETAPAATDAGNNQTSQRQRMLDALQSARQTRQNRNAAIDNDRPGPAAEQPGASGGNETTNPGNAGTSAGNNNAGRRAPNSSRGQ